jgi:hypothetical protein
MHKVEISPSEFAEKFLYLNGRNLSLDDYPHLRQIYNTRAREQVFKFSRQTAKSTTLANIMITRCAMIPHFKVLYISPSVDQTKVFSHDRVAPVIESSPIIKQHYVNSTLVQNVFMKQFINGSRMYLRYALANADRIRGYSADMDLFDETQDLKSEIIPIVRETMSRSEYKNVIFAGTPKRSRGALADIWFRSSMNEYAIKCSGCGKWNILGEENIGNYGVICSSCGKGISVREDKAQWVSTYSLTQEPQLEGYRLCLLHFDKAPWVDWKRDVILKRENSPSRAIFMNETLALEYDDGVTPITKMQLQACCDPERPMQSEPTNLDSSYQSIIGIDYGPINSENSNTVLVVVQRRPDKYHIAYMKKFVGKEADYSFIHKKVPELMKSWNATHLAADYGMGEAPNSEIRSRVGFARVVAFQHLRNQKEMVKWNPKMPAYTLNRTGVMTAVFNALKAGKISFPAWEYTEPFAEDILNICMESDEELGRTKYTNLGPDDIFHAIVYAIVSIDMMQGNTLLNIKLDNIN